MDADTSPFHAGERAAQQRAGAGDVASWAAGFIRDHLPEQHREFHRALPFVVMAGSDLAGRTWVTLIEGPDGFLRSPSPQRLSLATAPEASDPLAGRLAAGGNVGVLGIDLATRRRNRFNGRITATANGYVIEVHQSFGNCPQYITERTLTRASATGTEAEASTRRRPSPLDSTLDSTLNSALNSAQIRWIESADTLFIGSGYHDRAKARHNGYDASHRGGAPGFVTVENEHQLVIPDYAGNQFFNTLGNLVLDPRVALVFVDFSSGGLLHLSGRASIDWDPLDHHDAQARRLIRVDIEQVLERPHALSLRWARQGSGRRPLRVVRKVRESRDITSFYLGSVDDLPLAPFSAGQHLPIELQIPGQSGCTSRSYSLSGNPAERDGYRLSVKREAHGLMSRHLHDQIQPGALMYAGQPAGDLRLPPGEAPLVLISAGVGLTPMVAMLHVVATQTRPTWYLHGARNGQHHALRDEVTALIEAHKHLHQRLFYSQPQAHERQGRDFDVKGRITTQAILENTPAPDAHFVICGPTALVSTLSEGLMAHGVCESRIQFETF